MTDSSLQSFIFALIKQLDGNNIIAIPRLFVDLTGNIEAAIFLSQLLFWSDKGKRSDGFIYKSRQEWVAETGLTDYSLRKSRERLEELGILETKLHRANGAPTLHYRLQQEALVKEVRRFVEINESDLLKSTNGNVETNESMICRNQRMSNRDHQEKTPGGDDVGDYCRDCFDLLHQTGLDSAAAQDDAKAAHQVWNGDACRLVTIWEKRSWDEKVDNRLGWLRSKIKAGARPSQSGRHRKSKHDDDSQRFIEGPSGKFVQH